MESYIDAGDYIVRPASTHGGDLPDWLQDIDDPDRGKITDAVTAVYDTLEPLTTAHPTGGTTEIFLGQTSDDYIREELDGATGIAEDDGIVLAYDPGAEDWNDTLETATAHEYSHVRYIQQAREHGQGDGTYRKWQQLLLEAHGMHLADRTTDTEPAYRHAVDPGDLQERYDEVREELAKESAWQDGGLPFFGGSEDWPQWTGYSLAWDVGEELLEAYELDDLPALEKDDALDAVDTVLNG